MTSCLILREDSCEDSRGGDDSCDLESRQPGRTEAEDFKRQAKR